MDAQNGNKEGAPGGEELRARPPDEQDFVTLCRTLNDLKARYVVVGGFAIIYTGYGRLTEDIDLIIDSSPENEAQVFRALEFLPDQAVKELRPGDIDKYTVIRVADEIVIDLMKSAGGIDYKEASEDIIVRTIGGVPIPFASPRLLWRMKAVTHRAKDFPDLVFLRDYFKARGEEPPKL